MILGGSFYGISQNNSFLYILKKKCEPIKSQIVFTGFIPYEQLPYYLKVGDTAVIPSMWEEPFGLTCVEAMAAGLPMITTNSGGITEVCENCAVIINKDNDIIRNLQESIIKLYNDKNLQYELSIIAHRRSRQYNQKRYCIEFYLKLDNL